MRLGQVRSGVVDDYDPATGLGHVRADDVRYAFHCTAIADGSRQIPIGAPVAFVLRAGRLGRWEAAGLTTVERA
jgi:hypothetical protein